MSGPATYDGPGHYSHAVHLPQRQTASWDAEAYVEARQAAALGRQVRFTAAAAAPTPYAVSDSAADYPEAPAGCRAPRTRSEVAGKPTGEGSTGWDAQVYSQARQEAAQGREDRHRQAAERPAPFGTMAQPGESAFPSACDYRRAAPRDARVQDKVNAAHGFDPAAYADSLAASTQSRQERQARAFNAPPPYAVDPAAPGGQAGRTAEMRAPAPEVQGKVTTRPWDAAGCEAQRQACRDQQVATWRKNQGTANLLA
eukprot:scaffold4.g4933.t1